MAGEWGNRQELLHPRDTHGRFRNSFKVPENIISFLEKFNPKTFPSDDEAANYAKGLAQSDRFGSNRHAAISKFLRGYSTVNADLRAGKTNPEVAEIDKAMRPLPNELILNRVVGPEAFGLTPDNLAGIEEFRGKLIADKGFASTNIGTPMHRDGPSITMVIATPAGTKAIAPWSGGPSSREIILDRDQPFRVTKVQPDGKGGYYMMVAATEKGAPGKKPITLGGKAPQAPAAEVNQPNAPQTPQAPQAPAAPQAPQPVQQAPVRTGRPGRPAGPPPAPRNEPVHAESIGTGAPSTPVTPVPAAPGTPGQNPPGAELPPDPRIGFKEAYKTADVPVPGQGPRRATYNRAYLDLANRRTDPNEVVSKLDHEIALNDKIIESDRADGIDPGPLPEDNARLKKFSQFIKDHFNLEGAKKKEEPKAAAPKERAPRTPEGFEAPTPEQKAKSDAIKAARAERQKAAGIDRSKPAPRPTPTPEEKAARKERKIEADAAARKEVAKQRTQIRAERRARGEKPHEPTPEQQKAAEVARAAGEKRAAEQKVTNEKLDAEAKKVADAWLADSGVKESDLSDFDKTGLRILSGQVAQKKISTAEAKRRLEASSSPNLKKVGGSVGSRPTAREPKKNIPASSELEAAYKKTTIAQLRQQAADAGIDVPKSLRFKQDIFDHVTKELAKRELEKRKGGQAPSPDITKVLDEAGIKYGDLNPDEKKIVDTWVPAMARQHDKALRADMVRPAEEDKAKQPHLWKLAESIHSLDALQAKAEASRKPQTPAPVKKAAPKFQETIKPGAFKDLVKEAKPFGEHPSGPSWGTIRSLDAKPGDVLMYHGQDRKGPQSEGVKVRLEKGKYSGYNLVDAETGEPVHSFGSAHRAWLSKVPGESAPPLPAPTKAASAPRRDNTELKTRLKVATSRDDAHKLITQEKMTVPQLKQLAEEMDIAVTGNKDKIIGDIVHWSVGRRLDSAAVSAPGATTSRTLAKAAEQASGPKVSNKPVLANHWGVPGGEINFHRDGKLGIALDAIGNDERLEVPGENDNVANVIGHIATKGVRGDLTQKEMVAEVRKVAEKFPAGSKVRTNLERAVKDMDTPDNTEVNRLVKDLPEGSPTPIAELMHNLAQIPLANQAPRGTSRPTEIEKLQKIMQEWAQGKLTPLGFIGALHDRIFNQRHESEEGKFEIDRAVRNAIAKLEALMKKDRKLLYPIERR